MLLSCARLHLMLTLSPSLSRLLSPLLRAKLYASKVAQSVAGSAIEWAGGVGFTRETGIEKYWRDSKIGAIYEGTSNIQRQTIAKLLEVEMGLK